MPLTLKKLEAMPELQEALVCLDGLAEGQPEATIWLREWFLAERKKFDKLTPASWWLVRKKPEADYLRTIAELAARALVASKPWPSMDAFRLLWSCWNAVPDGRRTPALRAYVDALLAGHFAHGSIEARVWKFLSEAKRRSDLHTLIRRQRPEETEGTP